MTDLSGDIPTTEPLSTTIDADVTTSPSGGGTPKVDAEPSLRDTIAAEVKKGNEAAEEAADTETDDKPEAKTEEKPKAERGQDGKFASKAKEETAEVDPKPEPKVEEADTAKDAKHTEPPKSFLADSREKWLNVPRPVRRDIEIMARTHAEEIERTREATERYEGLRQYDDLARSNGRDLRQSVAKMAEVEDLLQRNPLAGLDAILREIGPRKQDGGYVSLYEIAQHIVEQPQAYQQSLQQAQQSQQPRVDPQLQAMQQQLMDTQAKLITAQVIEPFKAEHPRYDELQDSIAAFLNSDMISRSLSAAERLEQAYVMAERVNPALSQAFDDDAEPAPDRRAADSLNGSKSIRSAPGAVSPEMVPERGGTIGEILRDEARRMKRA